MTESYVPRTLSFRYDQEAVLVQAEAALSDTRLIGRPLILLGEAGSGKTELLRQWAGGAVATAKQVTNGWRSTNGRYFVDGLDEAAGLHDGDALDRVLGALEAQRNNDFVIACRVADWRSASGAATIREWTGFEPIELRIEPLGHREIISFLQVRNGYSPDDAQAFVTHYEDRGLGDWLGNPQTLAMLADVSRDGARPETMGVLFQLYVEKAWLEPRKQDTPLASARQQNVLDALGALFAALIVGGYDALTLTPGSTRGDNDLPLSECKALPGIAGLSDQQLNEFLNSRLVRGSGSDRLVYQHRRIGEYLGAHWLAAQAKTSRLRARLLRALQVEGLVPTNLRGLWAWLADDPALAVQIINTDPLAVIDYGNADTFNAKIAGELLAAIERAEDEHHAFGWREYRAASLLQPALSKNVERILSVTGSKRFWTQIILLHQMRDSEVVLRHQSTLRELMLDGSRSHAIRAAAAEALADFGNLEDWPDLILRLAQDDDKESLRLALVMMCNPNVGLTLSDAEFAEAIFDYSGLTPRFMRGREIGTVGLYYYGPRQPIEDDRIDGILDAMTDFAIRYPSKKTTTDAWDIQHLFFALLRRRLGLANVDPDRLWNWLSGSNYDRFGGGRDDQNWLNDWLQENDAVRRAMQRKLLDSCSAKPRALRRRMYEVPPGLHPTTEDIIELLGWLPEADALWSELIWFAPPREEGAAVRKAAERHARTEDDHQLLRDHAEPPPPPVDEEHRQWEERHEREERERREKLREEYLASRQRMQSGDWRALYGPAMVYMGRTYEAERDLPPEERIGAWIGDDLQAAAFLGFEAFLTADPPEPPSAKQIADSHAKSRTWHAALILSAGLAERQRTKRGFADLSTERVQAGLFAERVAFLDDNAWESLRASLIAELQSRDAWADAARTFIEPQLRQRTNYVSWLWQVLACKDGAALASEWLRNFPRLMAEPEEALIDHLLRDGSATSREALILIAKRRRKQKLDERRRRNWQAVELMLGTLPPERLSKIAEGDRSFLWTLRNRMGGRRRGGSAIDSPPSLLSAIVATFASLWPWTERPSRTTTGDVNAWDATEFLAGCLDTLASEPGADARAGLAALTGVDHGYGWKIARSIVDQRRASANADWQPPKIAALANLVTDGPPIDRADLQSVLLDELALVQEKIRSSSEDVWRFFYSDAANLEPYVEDQCSDALVTLLKQSIRSVDLDREKHLGDDREGDIWCTSNGLDLAIECKRHWHRDLWTAFDVQLAQQQAVDWRARGYGIYIVYWFGEHVHPVTGPPRGSGIARPNSPSELEAGLQGLIREADLSTIAVKVLDVSRPRP